jgi:1-pyrroline-5-carboxylate dehydrogenase
MSVPRFKNTTYTDFTRPENKRKMIAALEKVQAQLGREYDIMIGGEHIKTEQKLNSYNPSDKDEVVGVFQKATPELASKAVDVAYEKFQEWRRVKPHKRAAYLFKAARLMRQRKLEMDAYMIYEAGKNWKEAEGDTSEAIDFLEFYGREMLRYGGPQPVTKYPGEKPELRYIPLGVGIIIPPWNFPLAILTGMTSAAIVTGNTVVLKPSSDAPMMGQLFCELMQEAGLPDGVLNYLTGPGGAVGDTMIAHPKTRFIAFTGSKEVGIHVNELASKVQPGQIWLKRVIAEMGGKDGIVVDDQADVDEAAMGVTASAFGYQGQKCSACSRAIVVERIYNEFVSRLVENVNRLTVGPGKEDFPAGPVINQSSEQKILEYIEIGRSEGRLVAGGEKALGNGYFIKPTVFADVSSKARIAQEEIFGPVLAVIKAKDFEHALQIANDTEYGLTGSVYTKNRKKIEKAKDAFHVGNLYFNRKCTTALVGVHPFGGFNMSGTDSKAGGRDYLLLFSQAKAISEKVR